MLLLPVRIDRSPIHGLGLFTPEPVPRGTPIWRFEPEFDRAIPLTQWDQLPSPARKHIRSHAYLSLEAQAYIKSGDFACFMNHSDQPTTGAVGQGNEPITTVALRDLAGGEELTCDYWAFDGDAAWKLAASSH